MAIRLTFEVAGAIQLDKALDGYANALKDFRPVFKDIAADFIEIEQRQSESQGGGSWAPLSADYAAWKERHFPGQKILQLSGELMASMTGVGAGHVEEISKDRLMIGSTAFTGMLHQLGTSRMPARPVIQLTESDKTGWMKIMQRHAYDAAKEAGLI